jgi:hypothetical protein
LRRHVYRREGVPAKVKIKYVDGFVTWYRVTDADGSIGWQSGKPGGYEAVPYVGALQPFDPELVNDLIFWPEGEKDVDSLNSHDLLAFTFGGSGDGLPPGCAQFLSDRHIVILPDNDGPGHEHAQKKAVLAQAIAASVRLLELEDLPEKGDVSDWFALSHTADELTAIAEAARPWSPTSIVNGHEPQTERQTGVPSWQDPDWGILDDRRGNLPLFPVEQMPASCRKWLLEAAQGAGVTPGHQDMLRRRSLGLLRA